MNLTPLVSVIVPTYNSASTLRAGIRSVLEQTYTNLELIVVDDGSTDNTRELVSRVDDARIRYFHKTNSGVSAARNLGVLRSLGKWIAFLDADDLWLPQKIELQLHVAERAPLVGLIYCSLEAFEGISGQILGYYIARFRGRVTSPLLLNNFVGSPTPLVRRDVFEHVGLFDASRNFADDWGMWLRISTRYEFDFAPQVLCRYRVHGSVQSSRSPKQYEQEVVAFFQEFLSCNPTISSRTGEACLAHVYRLCLHNYLVRRKLDDAKRVAMASLRHRFRLGVFMRWITIATSKPERLDQYGRLLTQKSNARIALCKGEIDVARELCLEILKIGPLWFFQPYILLFISYLPVTFRKLLIRNLRLSRNGTVGLPYLPEEFVFLQY